MPLTPEEIEQIRNITKQAVDSGFVAFRQGFFIEPERHFREHEFLCDFKGKVEEAGAVARKVTLGMVIAAVVGMFVAGFLTKVKGG